MKILVADKFSESHLDDLRALGCSVDYNPSLKAEDLPSVIAPYKVLIVRSTKVSAETLKASNQLAMVLRAGAGVNTIDVKTASERGIYVTNCPGKNSIAVAELVFALLLSIDRRIPQNVSSLREHRWNKKEFSTADGVFGKTMGVIGTGQIGREVIRRAKAFGMPVIAWSRSLTPAKAKELEVGYCAEVDEIFSNADVVSMHLALTPETKQMVNASRLALMKPKAIFINTSRGEIVDQAALRESLSAGKIRAGLDVYSPEPSEASGDFSDPILDLPNLYGTHHIGASTNQAQEAIAEEAVRIVTEYVKTGAVVNCVNMATRTPASFQLVIRHFDRVGVLAFVMSEIRQANINIEEVQNSVFEGALAACCRIQLNAEPDYNLLNTLRTGNHNIIGVDLLRL